MRERYEEISNQVRMLRNSLKKLDEQEKAINNVLPKEHPDQRIPKNMELVGKLESKLQELR